MNPYRKGILVVLCLVALGLMLFGGLQLGLEAAKYALARRKYEAARAQPGETAAAGQRPPRLARGRCVFYAAPLLLGAGLLLKSPSLADRLAEDFDE